MTAIRLATAALSRRVFAGRANKAGDGFNGERHDVTSDVLKVVAEHIGMDCEATVCRDGEPPYIIGVKSIVERVAEVAAEQDALEQYVAEYETCCDEGYYAPTEHERGIIMDAMQGWLVDRDRLVLEARASVDTRPEGGDATEIAAPFTGGAVGEAETPTLQRPTYSGGE